MPIGVPRIIYCWGEELPAQWTDIYNFIFRRRMIFLMQYLDDELCNQICGLLINIHMEDRSKELEKKEMDKSGLFKTSTKSSVTGSVRRANTLETFNTKSQQKSKVPSGTSTGQAKNSLNNSVYELLTSEEDLAIDENFTLEQYTLQKITMDWLNWNSNFFNYNDLTLDEPYLFYLGEILAKDFTKENGNLLYDKSTQHTNLAYPTLGSGQPPISTEKNTYEIENTSKTDLDGDLRQTRDMSLNSTNTVQISQLLGIFKTMSNSSLLASRFNSLSSTKQKFGTLLNLSTKNFTPTGSCSDTKTLNNTRANEESFSQNITKNVSLLGTGSNTLSPGSSTEQTGTKRIESSGVSKRWSGNLAANSLQSVYSPFRFLANFTYSDFSLKGFLQKFTEPLMGPSHSTCFTVLHDAENSFKRVDQSLGSSLSTKTKTKVFNRQILKKIAKKQLSLDLQTHKNALDFSKRALSQRTLKRDSRQDNLSLLVDQGTLKNTSAEFLENASSSNRLTKAKSTVEKKVTLNKKAKNYLFNSTFIKSSNSEFFENSYSNISTNKSKFNKTNNALLSKEFSRKQTERTMQEEESKKVFVIINSFGGSVGNGITVHDALQFIKAGSLTLALGVAASASSLVLAGGTIGERYVTEGCHTMIHQPEGGISGQASDIWIDSAEIMKIRLDVAEIYSLSTYRPRHKILRDLDRDFYLTATETVYYGLADEIATNEVLSEIVEMTSKVWDSHESQQQRLLESRESSASGLDTQTQN